MSEEILNKYIELINKDYCRDCNELNCIDNFPHKKIANAIRELQQENQQLKEVLDELNKDKVCWINKCANAETMLHEREQVLDEIREYCKFGIKEWITDDGFVEEVLGDILQILNKMQEIESGK